MYSYGSPHTAAQKQDDQHERTFSSYVRIRVVVLRTCLGRWTIAMSGERGSGISVLPARYDDDDELLWAIQCRNLIYSQMLDYNLNNFYFQSSIFMINLYNCFWHTVICFLVFLPNVNNSYTTSLFRYLFNNNYDNNGNVKRAYG